MKKYLATYGKPRFLGIVPLSEDEYRSTEKMRLMLVSSTRGDELSELVGELNDDQEAEYRSLRTISEHGEGPVRGGEPVVSDLTFIRAAVDTDVDARACLEVTEGNILRDAKELVAWHQLPIKLIDAELLQDEKKLFFYFISEQRVDFRSLVKDLAKKFKTRIEMRQMGVRDEARIVKGLSSCGLPCCCSYWLNRLAPIGIKMVKEQNIALNPTKISGVCGRLMCCMGFEHKIYKDLWSGLPGPGSKIKTPNGNYTVISMDITKEAVICHKPTRGDLIVPVGLFAEFREKVMAGQEWESPLEQAKTEITRNSSSSVPGMSKNSGFVKGDQISSSQAGKPRDEGGAKSDKKNRKRPSRRKGRKPEHDLKSDDMTISLPLPISIPLSEEPEIVKQQPRPNKQTSHKKPRNALVSESAPVKNVDGDRVKQTKRRRRRPPKRQDRGEVASFDSE